MGCGEASSFSRGRRRISREKCDGPGIVCAIRGATLVLQTARKPNSVLDDHSSRRRITTPLEQPTRRFRLPFGSLRLGAPGRYAFAAWREAAKSLPIWSCSVWGLPCRGCYQTRGALLPHPFTLTSRLRKRRYPLCCTGRPDALKHPSRTLSGTLPCGVRTFLPRARLTAYAAAIIRPPASLF
jgi:hypothetical protein